MASLLLLTCVVSSFALCVQELAEVTVADVSCPPEGVLLSGPTPPSSVPLAGIVICLVFKPFSIIESCELVQSSIV